MIERIEVLNIREYSIKGLDFKSGDLPTIISRLAKEQDIINSPSAQCEGLKMIKAYDDSYELFTLPSHYSISHSGDELSLSADGSDNLNKVWYSRNRDRLMRITFERELKQRVLDGSCVHILDAINNINKGDK